MSLASEEANFKRNSSKRKWMVVEKEGERGKGGSTSKSWGGRENFYMQKK